MGKTREVGSRVGGILWFPRALCVGMPQNSGQTQTRVFWGDLGLYLGPSFRYPRVLCQDPPTPRCQLLRFYLSCPVGQQCPGGVWLHPLTAALLGCPFFLAKSPPVPSVGGNRPKKGCGRGLPRFAPPETPSQGPFTQRYSLSLSLRKGWNRCELSPPRFWITPPAAAASHGSSLASEQPS